MAARKTIWTPEIVRRRMRTTQLAKRLRDHAFGHIDMTVTQIKAAEIILRKCLPDLKAVEHSGTIATEQSRDDILARLTALHASAASSTLDRAVDGSADADGTLPKPH